MSSRDSARQNKATKAIKNRRVCYQCAYPISNIETMICPRCGSRDIDERRSKPKKTNKREAPWLPFPWNQLELEHGGTVILSGDAGSGKTTLCMALKPSLYVTSEQEIEQVTHSWYRINPQLPAPIITNCYTWEDLEEDLIGIGKDDLAVVDSVSQLAAGSESTDIVRKVIERVRDAQARCIFIVQFRKDGVMLGPNELNHQVDALATIPNDKAGMRRLAVTKNRYGGLFTTYFALDGTGVIPQEFTEGYTVEGPAGNYSLHQYPTPGAKWDGIFKFLEGNGIFIEGMASAALQSNAYRSGFTEPQDVIWRKKFAEDHDLQWIDPKTALQLVSDKLEEEGTTKEF